MAKQKEIAVGDVVFSGTAEGIELEARVTRVESGEYWAEVRLKGSQAAEEWKADPVTDNFDVFAFGVWLDGPGIPVWWGDLDLDGKPELLAPLPKGDLSPPVFRIFRWTGDNLLFLKKRALLVDSEGQLKWSQMADDQVENDWVESFQDGKAEVLSLRKGYLAREMVEVEPTKDGFKRAERK